MLVVIAALLGSVQSSALTLEAAYARALIRTKSVSAADRLARRYVVTRAAQMSCRRQLERDLAPLSCYELVDLERGWSVISEADRRRTKVGLDRRCARAAARLRVPAAVTHLDHLSGGCRARVRDARRTIAYRREDAGWSTD